MYVSWLVYLTYLSTLVNVEGCCGASTTSPRVALAIIDSSSRYAPGQIEANLKPALGSSFI
jgi:hypothetical protein